MSQKKPTSRRASGPQPAARAKSAIKRDLQDLNRRIQQLCNERARCVRELASADEARQLLQSIRPEDGARAEGPLTAELLHATFRELDSATCGLWKTPRIAYLGPEFSYSHLAAIHHFGQSVELMPASSIGGVFEAVERRDTDFGIVPIENSTDGRIVDTLDMFVRKPLRVCGEVPLRIHHNLLGRCGLPEIQEVHSKPQALSQCREWLSRHLPKAKLVPATSTTAAAELASRTAGVAAIASRQAGINYGLNVLAAHIEDNPDNVTRFAVIGSTIAARTGRDKTCLMFELSHEPGSLADAMMAFKRNRLNLTWIESFPKKGSQNEYLFFVELDGHERDLAVRRAIAALSKKTVRIEMLGSFPKADIAD
jgi:chorismate mutase/prephenate dehydratase